MKVALSDARLHAFQHQDPARGDDVRGLEHRAPTKVSEFEILDGSRVLGEKENVVEGIDGDFTLNLKPGQYTIACPGGSSAASGELIVAGAAPAATSDTQLAAATRGYTSYVETQAVELQRRVRKFTAAVKAGDVAAGQGAVRLRPRAVRDDRARRRELRRTSTPRSTRA